MHIFAWTAFGKQGHYPHQWPPAIGTLPKL
jgi:hypothetical protein